MKKTTIFISHAAEEKAAAMRLKGLLRAAFGGCSVFVSSDYESIPGGEPWFTRIVEGLQASAVVLVLLSEVSKDRPWINFEAGVGLGAGALVIPIVTGGLNPNSLDFPLCAFEIRSLEDSEGVSALVNDVGLRLGLAPKLGGLDVIAADFSTIARESIIGWKGASWMGIYLAIDGPLSKLQQLDLRTYQESMAVELRRAGLTPRLTAKHSLGPTAALGYKTVYATDKRTFRSEIHVGDTILVAKSG